MTEFPEALKRLLDNWLKAIATSGSFNNVGSGAIIITPKRQSGPKDDILIYEALAFVNGQEMHGVTLAVPTALLLGEPENETSSK